jgi:LytS/YehU family sensor histidine kinase
MDLSDPKITYGFLLTELTGFITSGFLRIIYRRIKNFTKSIIKLALKISIISILLTFFWFFIDFLISIPLHGFKELYSFYTPNIFLRTLWSQFYTLILWSTLYFVIKFWIETKTQKENAEKAILLAQSAQLQMLRYQVNPHFLFNSLSSLRALVRDNQKKAEEMILQISKFLRYSLISKKNNQVRLKEEIAALSHYFEIERVRFGEKLVTEIQIEKAAEDLLIPSFLIHPIIENAIKYGMDTSPMPLTIRLSAMYKNSQLYIDVINTGHWVKNNAHRSGTGTGLKNVKQRLDLAFPDSYTFEINKTDETVHIQIQINYD